jgi:hypothetical protein
VAGSVSSSFATGTVSGSDYVGGLVGQLNGGSGIQVTNSYASGNVSSTTADRVGGLIGFLNSSATLQDCHTAGTVTSATYYAGGLIGYANPGLTLSRCYARGNVVAAGGYAGGLIGYLVTNATSSSLESCYAFGNVSSPSGNYVGGLIGRTNNSNSTITACMASGNVSSDASFVGGLVGDEYGNISNSYSVGRVSGNRYVGGLVGYHRSTSTIADSYAIGNIGRTSGSFTSDFGALVGHKDAAASLTDDVFNSEATITDLGTGTPFSANSYGTGLTSAQMQVQTNFTGFTFGVGTTDWKMPASGYIAPWNSSLIYQYPILGYQ